MIFFCWGEMEALSFAKWEDDNRNFTEENSKESSNEEREVVIEK